jgi:hypothetical protein
MGKQCPYGLYLHCAAVQTVAWAVWVCDSENTYGWWLEKDCVRVSYRSRMAVPLFAVA